MHHFVTKNISTSLISNDVFLLSASSNKICPCFSLINFQSKRNIKIIDHWTRFDRWQDRVKSIEDERLKQKWLKVWIPQPKWFPFPPAYISPERLEHDLPSNKLPDEKTREEHGRLGFDGIQRFPQLRYVDLSKEYQQRRQYYEMIIALQYDQRLIPERQQALGVDLAAAHFLVNRSAAVKFLNDDTWHQMDNKGDYLLPAKKVEGLFIEAIDATKTQLMFEAFDHLVRLKKLRYLSLAEGPFITDWCLGRMNQFESTLQYLDLSHCKRISANGLSALACLKKLKFLRLDGLDHVQDIAKAALMLEDKIPGLTVVGVDYDKAMEETLKREKLMSHPSVREDARGNLFLKDEVGEMYYLKNGGRVELERPIVDEDELPLFRSNVRPDPPVIPDSVALELDRLSDHKLRHLLCGSPSGLDRRQEIDRILKLDAKRLLNKQKPRLKLLLEKFSVKKPAPLPLPTNFPLLLMPEENLANVTANSLLGGSGADAAAATMSSADMENLDNETGNEQVDNAKLKPVVDEKKLLVGAGPG